MRTYQAGDNGLLFRRSDWLKPKYHRFMKEQNKTHRQVRQGVFESNSSSTHSLTIQTKRPHTPDKEPLPLPLVLDNVLCPDRLASYERSVGETSMLSCGDKDMKASIVVQWIASIAEEYGYYCPGGGGPTPTPTEVEAAAEKWFKKSVEYLRVKLGYSEIYYLFDTGADYTSHEEDNTPLEYDEDMTDQLDNLIKTILDDTMEIVDSNSGYSGY